MIIKKHKLLWLLTLVYAIALLLTPIVKTSTASAALREPGCYVASAGTQTQVTCPASLNANPQKCYFAEGGSSGITAYEEGSCEIPEAATPSESSGNFQGDCKAEQVNKENCGIIAYLVLFINVLSVLVGIVVVLMIAIGGIQYSASRDNPQATAAAKDRIRNAVIALVAYLFIYAFLQYIIPGGVL